MAVSKLLLHIAACASKKDLPVFGGGYLAIDLRNPPPDASSLGRHWHEMMEEAREIFDLLPGDQAGTCVMDFQEELFRGGPKTLADALHDGGLRFHAGSIKGALPKIDA
jgi:hypothetical protein